MTTRFCSYQGGVECVFMNLCSRTPVRLALLSGLAFMRNQGIIVWAVCLNVWRSAPPVPPH